MQYSRLSSHVCYLWSINKAIILKWKGTIVIVGKNLGQYGKEAQNSYNGFANASILPWIPIIPGPDKSPNLDKEWEENDYSLNLGRSVTS